MAKADKFKEAKMGLVPDEANEEDFTEAQLDALLGEPQRGKAA